LHYLIWLQWFRRLVVLELKVLIYVLTLWLGFILLLGWGFMDFTLSHLLIVVFPSLFRRLQDLICILDESVSPLIDTPVDVRMVDLGEP
jgi:hypothetical protein